MKEFVFSGVELAIWDRVLEPVPMLFIGLGLGAIIAGLIWAGIENNNQAPEWPAAVTTHPLANAHISWEQSFHGGAWNE